MTRISGDCLEFLTETCCVFCGYMVLGAIQWNLKEMRMDRPSDTKFARYGRKRNA